MDRIERLQRLGCMQPGTLALGGGLPAAELFPRAGLGRAFIDALNQPSPPALQYGWPEGSRDLRAWIADRLRSRGADVSASDVIVTSGAQQALMIAATMLVPEGARVDVDAESYPAALDVFRQRRARLVVGVPPIALACTYVMPGVANPRGNGLGAERRTTLLASGAPIIADEAYAELRFDGVLERPLLADARDRTWHVGTFSKTLCPGLRVGFLVPPRDALEEALRVKQTTDLQAGSLAQAVLEEFLAHDDFDARLERARRFYHRRAERLVRALRRHFPSWTISEPEGGFSVFVETGEPGDDAELLAMATAHGVSFDPGRLFRPSAASSPIAMRICYSAAKPKDLEEGVSRLERAWRAWRPPKSGSVVVSETRRSSRAG